MVLCDKRRRCEGRKAQAVFETDIPSEVHDHSPTQGAWVWSLRSGVMRWSAKMYEIFGVTPRDFDTTIESYSRMIHPADRRRVQVTLMQGIREGQAGPLIYRIVRPDGKQRMVEAAIRAEYDMEGVIRRVSGVLTDVTDRATGGAAHTAEAVTKPPATTPLLIDEWCALGRDLADRRGLAFESRIDDALPAVLPFDETLVTQIVSQLLRNACQFTVRGKVGLSVMLRDPVLEICVYDTGIGIPPHATMLALRGRRLHGVSSHCDEERDAGSGLPMVRSYVERLGGSLMVASAIGIGTKFTITLPLPVGASNP